MVESDGLENRCAGNGTVGSNPTLSATFSFLRRFFENDALWLQAPHKSRIVNPARLGTEQR